MSKLFQIVVADPPWLFSDKLQHSDVKRGAAANYDTMSISEIAALPVKNICDPDGAILCLWVPSSLLQEGLDIMKAWGFKHKQTYIWVKTKKAPLEDFLKAILNRVQVIVKMPLHPKLLWKDLKNDISYLYGSNHANIRQLTFLNKHSLSFGMGRLFRQTHEICLIGTSNNKIYKQLQNKSQRSVSFATNLKHSTKPENLQDSLDIMFPSAKGKIELFARRERKDWTCLGNEVGDCLDIREAIDKL